MPLDKTHTSRIPAAHRMANALTPTRSDFYREEFLKHQQCLERQREYYSERVIGEVEAAIQRILAELDRLCASQDADVVVSRLLRKIDVLTGLSAWSDPKKAH